MSSEIREVVVPKDQPVQRLGQAQGEQGIGTDH